jgi:hypothetical protein
VPGPWPRAGAMARVGLNSAAFIPSLLMVWPWDMALAATKQGTFSVGFPLGENPWQNDTPGYPPPHSLPADTEYPQVGISKVQSPSSQLSDPGLSEGQSLVHSHSRE